MVCRLLGILGAFDLAAVCGIPAWSLVWGIEPRAGGLTDLGQPEGPGVFSAPVSCGFVTFCLAQQSTFPLCDLMGCRFQGRTT